MKKLRAFVFIIALSLVALLEIAAQQTSFDEKTLNVLKKNAAAIMEGRKLRIVNVSEELADEGKVSVSFNKSIREILPPDRRRYIFETRKASGGIERVEYIDIGEKHFVRRNDGDWEIFAPSGSGMGMGNGIGGEMPKVETTTVRTLIRGETINNQKVDLYKTVDITKFIYAVRTYMNVYTESYWFDNNGRMIKYSRDSRNGEMKTVSRTTEEYDYNAEIKIEEPRVSNASKKIKQ